MWGASPPPPSPQYLILISALIHFSEVQEAEEESVGGGHASRVVLGGRTRGNTNTCQPEEGEQKEANVAPRPRPVGSICSSQDFCICSVPQ